MTALVFRSSGRVVAAIVAAIVLLVAGGCSLTRPAPLKHTFLIDPPAPAAMTRVHPGSLRVGAIGVAAPFRGKAFVYRATELNYEADFYSEFLVPPGALIGEATARGLDRTGVFAKVIPPGALPDGDYVLDGFVSTLYGDVRDPAKPMVELTVAYYLTRNHDVGVAPVWTREYQRRVAVAGAAPEGYARALSAALGEIVVELGRDLAAADLARK